jgi:hypothetical protein
MDFIDEAAAMTKYPCTETGATREVEPAVGRLMRTRLAEAGKTPL